MKDRIQILKEIGSIHYLEKQLRQADAILLGSVQQKEVLEQELDFVSDYLQRLKSAGLVQTLIKFLGIGASKISNTESKFLKLQLEYVENEELIRLIQSDITELKDKLRNKEERLHQLRMSLANLGDDEHFEEQKFFNEMIAAIQTCKELKEAILQGQKTTKTYNQLIAFLKRNFGVGLGEDTKIFKNKRAKQLGKLQGRIATLTFEIGKFEKEVLDVYEVSGDAVLLEKNVLSQMLSSFKEELGKHILTTIDNQAFSLKLLSQKETVKSYCRRLRSDLKQANKRLEVLIQKEQEFIPHPDE